MGDADDTIVQVTTSGGEQFFKHFYNYMDTNRKDIRNLYHEQSKARPAPVPAPPFPPTPSMSLWRRPAAQRGSREQVIWNGHTIQGRAGVEKFLSDLPASKHEPSSLDCQPIADTTGAPPSRTGAGGIGPLGLMPCNQPPLRQTCGLALEPWFKRESLLAAYATLACH